MAIEWSGYSMLERRKSESPEKLVELVLSIDPKKEEIRKKVEKIEELKSELAKLEQAV